MSCVITGIEKKMKHALRCITESFINLFIKNNPHVTKYIYKRLNGNLQVPLKEISKKSVQFIYFQVTYYLVFWKSFFYPVTQNSTAECSLWLTTNSMRVKRKFSHNSDLVFKNKLQRTTKTLNKLNWFYKKKSKLIRVPLKNKWNHCRKRIVDTDPKRQMKAIWSKRCFYSGVLWSTSRVLVKYWLSILPHCIFFITVELGN